VTLHGKDHSIGNGNARRYGKGNGNGDVKVNMSRHACVTPA